jgi:hypothetical protein
MDDNLYLKTERFGLGDVIVEGWRFFLKDFWKLIAMTIICVFPIFGALAAIQPSISSLAAGGVTSSNASSIVSLTLLLSCSMMLLSAFLVPLYVGALSHIVRQRALGQPVGLGGALRFGLSRWASVFSASFIGGIIILLLSLLLVVPGMIFGVYYTFGYWAAAVRGVGGKNALDYSKKLVSGQWWRVFGITAGLYVIYYGLLFILALFLTGANQNFLLIALYYILGSFLVCLMYVMTVVFLLNVDPEPTPLAAESIPLAAELAAAISPLAESKTPPQAVPEYPVAVDEPSSEPVSAPTAAPASHNNPAAAALVLALLVVAAAAGGFLMHRLATSIVIAIAAGLVIVCAVVLGISGLRQAARLEGKGRWPALSSLGLSLAAVALLAVLIFVPFMQTFSTSDLSLNYTTNWTQVDGSQIPTCQKNNCLLVMSYKGGQTAFLLIKANYSGQASLETLEQNGWDNIQKNASSQGANIKLVDISFIQVDGLKALRRTYSQDTSKGTAYVTWGFILAKSALFEYVVSLTAAADHQAVDPEIDQMIQSIHFTP